MRIHVLYFAVFRERLGRADEDLELPAGATAGDALAALEGRHPTIAALRGHYRIAVNQAMTTAEAVLADGDELVLIPPVAGGNDRVHVAILDAPLSLDRCLAAVISPETGGVCTFTGLVRRHSRGVTVERFIDVSALPPAMRQALAFSVLALLACDHTTPDPEFPVVAEPTPPKVEPPAPATGLSRPATTSSTRRAAARWAARRQASRA